MKKKSDEQKWAEETTDCALAVMDLVQPYNPQAVIPALVSVLKAVISMAARDDESAMSAIDLIKGKLDDYKSYEHEELKTIMAVGLETRGNA